jgi:hypothetical protein
MEYGVNLFYSCAQKDEPYIEQLEKHLHVLRRQGIINSWHNQKIVAGTEWADEIDNHLE